MTTFADIRSSILESLSESPKTIHEITQHKHISRTAVVNHLNHLWRVGRVCPCKPIFKSDEEYWMVRQ